MTCAVLLQNQARDSVVKKVKVAHTRLPSVGFRSWSRFLTVSLQVTWVINQAVGCHYFPPRLQLPPQPLRGLLPVLLLGEQRHCGCEQFAWDCYPTASRLRFEPTRFCAWVQHANHSATEPPHIPLYFSIKFRIFSRPRGICSLWRTTITSSRVSVTGRSVKRWQELTSRVQVRLHSAAGCTTGWTRRFEYSYNK